MNKKRRLISYVLSIFLVIALFISILLTTLNCTILSTINVKRKIADADYYAAVQALIIDNSQNYLLQSGFDESIMNNVVNDADVKKDIDGVVDCLYEGRAYTIQTDSIRANLNTNIATFIENNNYVVDEENQKSIDACVDKIADIYTRNIEYSSDIVKRVSQVMSTIKKVVPVAMVICGAITLLLMVIIWHISRPSVGISFLATGAILIYLKVCTGVNVAINNILLVNKSFSNILIGLSNQVVHKIFVIGVILCIAGVIIIVYTEAKRKIRQMLLLEEHSQVIR